MCERVGGGGAACYQASLDELRPIGLSKASNEHSPQWGTKKKKAHILFLFDSTGRKERGVHRHQLFYPVGGVSTPGSDSTND